jgi:hypothetical protein
MREEGTYRGYGGSGRDPEGWEEDGGFVGVMNSDQVPYFGVGEEMV